MNKFVKILASIFTILLIVIGFFYFQYKPTHSYEWGLTFSYQEARGLGFDWKTMYLDILSDLQPKNLRLMTYWEDTEKVRGEYDFTMSEEMIIEAQKRNVNVLLVVGHKQPRWPECHEPDWYKKLNTEEKNQAVLDMVKATVEHFRSYTTIKAWQVENEPYFGFGSDCSTLPKVLFNREVELVKSLDKRPVVVTDSGDRGGWISAAESGADVLGFTLYRTSYDDTYGGYYKYPIPAMFYRVRAGIVQTFVHTKEVWDVELQMEPWFTNGALNTPIVTQKALMNPKVFDANINYAQNTNISKHYLWGVEWWYWMAQKNNDWGMWNAAKKLLSN